MSPRSPLLLIPGPTPVAQPVLEALARPTVGHTTKAATRALRRIQEGVATAVGAEPEALVLVLPGSGTMGLEAALVNLLAPGEKLLVVSQGFFGERFAAVGEALGAKVTTVSCPWGEQVSPERVEEALRQSGAKVMTLTQVDTSTGAVSAFRECAALARARGVTVVLDAVAGAGGMAVEMAEVGIDVLVTASQKALGAPPGLAILVVSAAALERRRQLGGCASYFLDWLRWEAPMRDAEHAYFATLPTNLLAAGEAAVASAEEEGWEERFARHHRLARAVRRGMRAMGLPSMTAEEISSPTVTALRLPEGLEPAAVCRETALEGVAVATGLGAWKDSAIRVGHMGSVGLPELLQGTAALEASLRRLGAPVEMGAGVAELVCGWEDGERG